MDAVLEAEGIRGETTIRFSQGQAVLINMGNGPAVNVSYALQPVEVPPGANVARPSGHLQNIPPGKTFVTPIPRGALQIHKFDFTANYESLSGRRYETKIRIDNLVLISFQFKRA
jgi:hypothetical protein